MGEHWQALVDGGRRLVIMVMAMVMVPNHINIVYIMHKATYVIAML